MQTNIRMTYVPPGAPKNAPIIMDITEAIRAGRLRFSFDVTPQGETPQQIADNQNMIEHVLKLVGEEFGDEW